MFQVYDIEHPDVAAMCSYYRTREEAQRHIDGATGARRDEDGFMVHMVGSDFLAVREVERESKPCRFCGGEVQSNDPGCDFCRGCYYQGRIFEEGTAGIVAALKAHPMINADTVGVWHTGGGCFCVGATYRWDAGTEVDILTSAEASVDVPPSVEEPWGMCLTGNDGEEYVNGDNNLTSTADIVAEVDRLIALWESGVRA